MHKPIPYTRELRLRLVDNAIVDTHDIVIPDTEGVLVSIGSSQHTLPASLMKHLAFFEFNHSWVTLEVIESLSFHKTTTKLLSSQRGVYCKHSEPIYYLPGYRIVPNYPRYAISSSGALLDTVTNAIVSVDITVLGYLDAYIYNPAVSANRNTKHHRLVALAWVDYVDLNNTPIVNHLDGNKCNNDHTNLEWCNSLRNNAHARELGLVSDEIPMKVRDKLTGEITHFKSVAEMSRELNMKHVIGKGYTKKLPGYLYKRRYEIKFEDDTGPWFYADPRVDTSFIGKTIFILEVENTLTGITKLYNRRRPLAELYPGAKTAKGIEEYVANVRKAYPMLKVKLTRFGVRGPYIVKCTATGEITSVCSIPAIAKITGVNRNTLRTNLFYGNRYSYNGYIVKCQWDTAPDSDYVPYTNTHIRVEVTDLGTGVTTMYNSIRHCSREVGVVSSTVAYRAKMNGVWNNLKFRSV